MRKLRLFLALALCGFAVSSAPVGAAPGGCTNDGTLAPFADEVLTISSTAKALTATVYAPAGVQPADMAVCTVETDSVRYRVAGVPTAAIGQLVIATATAPASLTVCGNLSLRKVLFIRVTTDASLSCSYYRRGDS
jgi:hypothetical protein